MDIEITMLCLRQSTAAFAIAMISLIAGCSSGFETSGIVLDGDGNPLSYATVCLYDFISPEFDDFQPVLADGKFLIGISTGAGVDRFRLVTRCPGYHDDERLVYRDDDIIHRIVLSRLPVKDDIESGSVGIETVLDEASVKFVPETPDRV